MNSCCRTYRGEYLNSLGTDRNDFGIENLWHPDIDGSHPIDAVIKLIVGASSPRVIGYRVTNEWPLTDLSSFAPRERHISTAGKGLRQQLPF